MANADQAGSVEVEQTDYSRWRLEVDHGRHVWRYLRDDDEAKAWKQTEEDKYWLGLELDPPSLPLPTPTTPLEAASNGFSFYKRLQSADGHWSGEYGGPMFLIPGLVIGMYVTHTPVPDEWRVELVRYLFNRRNKADGGWGLHIEGRSTAFGTVMNYVALRLLRVEADHPFMVKARATMHGFGGGAAVPSWAKLWLSVLNVYEWEGLNPVPPELWALPDWVPVHPWRWWIHTRNVYIPMGYLYGKKFKAELDPLLESLREEIYTEPYETIDWPAQRNNIAAVDIYAPHTRVLETLMGALSVYEQCLFPPLRRYGIRRAYELVVMEDENTCCQDLGPVNKMLNMIVRWDADGPESEAFKMHVEKLKDFLWLGAEGMMMCGTNGSQLWDCAFISQAIVESGLANESEENKRSARRALEWLDDCQIRENPKHYKDAYRFATKGAWPFSTKEQGYTVSDCTAEGMKAVLALQEGVEGMPTLVSKERLCDTVDLLLTMQNSGGGFASYETINGPQILEYINPAEVFGDIMTEFSYPECTTSVLGGLATFKKTYPDYRSADIDRVTRRAISYIHRVQRPDGSWFGSWGICFTYATMFALESLSLAGETFENSERVRRACAFLIGKQKEDGGWGETFESCVTGEYVQHETSQVVQTAWAVLALLHARLPDPEPVKQGVKLIMSRQRPDGRWEQESIEGIFNKNCAISYPNFKHSFTIWALGKAHRRFEGKVDWSS